MTATSYNYSLLFLLFSTTVISCLKLIIFIITNYHMDTFWSVKQQVALAASLYSYLDNAYLFYVLIDIMWTFQWNLTHSFNGRSTWRLISIPLALVITRRKCTNEFLKFFCFFCLFQSTSLLHFYMEKLKLLLQSSCSNVNTRMDELE